MELNSNDTIYIPKIGWFIKTDEVKLLEEFIKRQQERFLNLKCTCSCHTIPGMMHFVPCCDKTYEQW